jgi:hypothetical protein
MDENHKDGTNSTPIMSRRTFLESAAVVTTGFTIPALPIFSAESGLPPGQKALSEADGLAKSLGYRADANKVDVKKFPKRGTPESKTQFCDNCSLYVGNPNYPNWGACSIFPNNKVVAAKGWCNTWSPK